MIKLNEVDLDKIDKSVGSQKDVIKLRLIKLNKHLELLKGQQQFQAKNKDVKGFKQGQAELKKLYDEKDLLMQKYNKLGKVEQKITKRFAPKVSRINLQKVIDMGERGIQKLGRNKGKVGVALAVGGLAAYAAKKRRDEERY